MELLRAPYGIKEHASLILMGGDSPSYCSKKECREMRELTRTSWKDGGSIRHQALLSQGVWSVVPITSVYTPISPLNEASPSYDIEENSRQCRIRVLPVQCFDIKFLNNKMTLYFIRIFIHLTNLFSRARVSYKYMACKITSGRK